MFKTILVPLLGLDYDQSTLSTAALAAACFGAHMDCLCVRADMTRLISQAVNLEVDAITGRADGEYIAAMVDLDKGFSTAAKRTYSDFLAKTKIRPSASPSSTSDVTIAWHEKSGDLEEIAVQQARLRDLVVLGRPTKDVQWPVIHIGRVVLECGRPVLIAPHSSPRHIGETIAIAWKNTPEAAGAITAAMPFLEKAKHVVVIAVQEEATDPADCVNCAESLADQLRWHGIRSEARYVIPGGRSIPDTVLSTAHERDADLLVMGGYGHSRLREFIFGGMTRRVLDANTLPVLMVH